MFKYFNLVRFFKGLQVYYLDPAEFTALFNLDNLIRVLAHELGHTILTDTQPETQEINGGHGKAHDKITEKLIKLIEKSEEIKELKNAGLRASDSEYAYWLRDIKELRKEYRNYLAQRDTSDKEFRKPEASLYRNILLIGRTGNGKSTLANVLVNKEGEFEEVFKEGHGSASETRKISDKLFEINGIKYRIIDTPGLGDTRLSKIETLQEIAKVYDKVKDGLNQIFFVNNGKFTPEEVETYNTLKEILFDENITKYTSIVRTNFAEFENEEECKKDIQSLLVENNKAITEMIESCNKIIHVDNPPLKGRYKKISKDSREKDIKLLDYVRNVIKLIPDIGGVKRVVPAILLRTLKIEVAPPGALAKFTNLNDSQDITADFLQEVAYYKLFKDDYDGVVKCFGISQDPATKEYIMVMDYIKNGDLRKYLTKYYQKLDFYNKLGQLFHLTKGLNNIHRQGLIHRDFHPGNILISNSDVCLITDLGLCRPVNETNKEEKIYGVLPYVAPEVLQGKIYTQAADIYSLGIVAYELFSGRPPYHELTYDHQLAYKICQGLRPNFTNIRGKKDTEFYRQYLETEELNQTLISTTDKISLDYQAHPQTYTSRLLETDNLPEPQNSQEINEKFYELYSSSLPYDFANLDLEESIEDWSSLHPEFNNSLFKDL
ncbi:10427_t:CDS:2 [Ambispora leptoticha]|uniref:non-specific serine/threonine protein kinase n=1 Tax=Ambispora leptoticha TaxID=144679 RepID=A0A9N9G3J0_9GLOM|nr:10427_t:CDS:2 [Ambispora leptoticha]